MASNRFGTAYRVTIRHEAKILARILYKVPMAQKKRKAIGMILTFARKRHG
jgi:hypothetical protein